MNNTQATHTLNLGVKGNPAQIEKAYFHIFGIDLRLRLLTLVADYPEPNKVNTELDKFGWKVMDLVSHLYGTHFRSNKQ